MKHIVMLENVHKIYPNGIHAVRGLSLKVEEGEVLGLLGPNGAGKTTTMNLMIGLLKPTKGRITIFGKSFASNGKEIQQRIGVAPQEFSFYAHLTVFENAKLFATLYSVSTPERKIDELFSLFELEEIRGQRADQLSGGQKRRLNLTLALLHDPEMIILDEPAAGMDPQSRAVLWSSIKYLADSENKTIILATHLMEVADRLSDRIAIIDHGKLLIVDKPENLKQKFGHGETINIRVAPHLDADDILLLRSRIEEILPHVEGSDHSFRIYTDNSIEDLSRLLEMLNQADIRHKLIDVSIRSETLEDVFIKLTGRKLRE